MFPTTLNPAGGGFRGTGRGAYLVTDYDALPILLTYHITTNMSTLEVKPNIDVDESTQTDAPLLDTDDVTELIENIKSASSSELPYGSSVFDHSAMAPASPASAVSQIQLNVI